MVFCRCLRNSTAKGTAQKRFTKTTSFERQRKHDAWLDSITLRFKFVHFLGNGILVHDLQGEVSPSPTPTKIFDITALRVSKRSKNSTIYQARINQHTDAILKFAVGPAQTKLLYEQADLYRVQLRSFQGSTIPTLYTILQGSLPVAEDGHEGYQRYLCLVLEDCGKSVSPYNFDHRTELERHQILEMFRKFHEIGCHPEKFDETHVLQGKDDKWRMVGFHTVKRHECRFKEWKFGGKAWFHERTKSVLIGL
ncbi:hypothetical protein BDZ94DRAFT_83417 [Collybia nuda]|uniref:Uncharacterized protein n=1 Tax=Collybia nuda TaxID=64659 RepID=A0A9P6CDX0_9AGAR|nr:hypothetical protein BDZ94DRAFT_83417 [Collybia nuda]